MTNKNRFAIALFLTTTLLSGTAMAQDLLGGLLGGGDSSESSSVLGLVGGSDSGALVTLGSGDAGSSGLVNVGLGGDSLVDANVGGGSSPLVDASVLGSSGLVDVNANVGGLGANVNVGGSGGLISIGIGGGKGNNGGNGGNGNNGNNGQNANNGQNGNNTTRNGNGNGTGFGAVATAACAGSNPNQLVSVFQSSNMRGWNRATNIQLVPIRVCAEVRKQVSGYLAGNGDYHRMIGAVAGDSLINAALSRGKYQPGHVLGVEASGSTLTVYVF